VYQEKEKDSHDHGRGSNALNLGSCVVAVARNPVRPVTCSKHPRVLGFLQFDPGALIWWRCVATMGLLFSRICCTRTRSRLNVDPNSSLRILLPVVLRFQSQKRHSRPGPSLLLYPHYSLMTHPSLRPTRSAQYHPRALFLPTPVFIVAFIAMRPFSADSCCRPNTACRLFYLFSSAVD
jgi:hypothetical protein